MVQRNFAIAAFVISLFAAVPSALFIGLILVNSVNPLQVIFISSFNVRNESGEILKVWVAGRHESGRIDLLPLFATSFPAVPTVRTGGFAVRNRESVRITYDWDDYNFTSILVERRNGDLYATDVDVDTPHSDCCYRNRSDQYSLPSVASMRPATAVERTARDRGGTIAPRLLFVYTAPFLSVFLYLLQRRLGTPIDGSVKA